MSDNVALRRKKAVPKDDRMQTVVPTTPLLGPYVEDPKRERKFCKRPSVTVRNLISLPKSTLDLLCVEGGDESHEQKSRSNISALQWPPS